MYICLDPECSVIVTDVSHHLRTKHPALHDQVKAELDTLLPVSTTAEGPAFLPDFHHSRAPPTMPYLRTVQGRVCRSCHFALACLPGERSGSFAKRAQKHIGTCHPGVPLHPWEDSYLSGIQTLQTFHHPMNKKKARYFPVGPPLPLDWVERPLTDDENDANFTSFTEFLDAPLPYNPVDDLHNIHPVLRQYKFHHYLGDSDRRLIAKMASGTVLREEPPSFAIVSRLIKATFSHIAQLTRDTKLNPGTSRPNMQWIWSILPDASVFGDHQPTSAYLENIAVPTLLANYTPTVTRLVLIALRYLQLDLDTSAAAAAALELVPAFPLGTRGTAALKALVDLLERRSHLKPYEQDALSLEDMAIVMDVLQALLHDTRDASEGDNPNPPLVFRFIAMIAARADGSFAPCSLLTGPTTHLITATRGVVLWLATHRPPPSLWLTEPSGESVRATTSTDRLLASILHYRHHVVQSGRSTPFVFLHSFFNIATVLAKDEASFTPHVWTDGSRQSKFTADGAPFDTRSMAQNLKVLRDEVCVAYGVVLRGFPLHDIPIEGLVDDPRSLKPGYSFVTDPANNLRSRTLEALRYFESEGERGVADREPILLFGCACTLV